MPSEESFRQDLQEFFQINLFSNYQDSIIMKSIQHFYLLLSALFILMQNLKHTAAPSRLIERIFAKNDIDRLSRAFY